MNAENKKQTILKAEALEICQSCKDFGIKGCILTDIEGCKTENILTIPDCIDKKIKSTDTVRTIITKPIDNERIKSCVSNTSILKSTDTVRTITPQSTDTVRTMEIKNETPIRTVSKKTQKNAQSKKQNSAFSHRCIEGQSAQITKSEEEILRLISQGITNTNRMAKLRNCKVRIIQTHIKNLKVKGIINKAFEIVRISGGTNAHSPEVYRERAPVETKVINSPAIKTPRQEPRTYPEPQLPAGSASIRGHEIRLHGEQFLIDILEKEDSYSTRLGKRITIDHNTILCHKDKIEIYSNTSFFGKDAQDACTQSEEYWNRMFAVIENDLKITIVKERAQNIKMVKTGHYAEIGSEMAIDAEEKSYKIQIRTTDDKKVWFLVDNSFNLHEAETVHSQTSKADMQGAIEKHLNDWRDNMGMPKQSELTHDLQELIKITNEHAKYTTENAAGLNAVIQILKTILPKQQEVENHEESKNQNSPGGYQ